MELEPLMRGWDGLATITHFDHETGSWIFIAIHDDTLGVPMGGTRLSVYPTPGDALRDAMRLAEGMTHKWAAVEFQRGGGKAVIAPPEVPRGALRQGLLRRYGRLLASLKGSFGTGQDLGITPEDMRIVAGECDVVHGVDTATSEMLDAGPYTACGVVRGIEAGVRHVYGARAMSECTVWIQGVGDVGAPLAERLSEVGTKLLISDLDAEKSQALAKRVGGKVVDPALGSAVECEVYAPCAIGGTLNRESIAELRCRIVAGSANNQLESPGDADHLHARGILYAPDYVINAGGAICFGMKHDTGAADDAIGRRIDGIATSLDQIFAEAKKRDESPLHSARRRVERVLEEGRARRGR